MAPLIVSSLSITFTHSFLHGTQDTALSYIPALLIYVTIKVYCQLYWLWDPSMGLVEYISSVLGVVHRFNLKVYVWPLLLSTLGLLPCVLSISWPQWTNQLCSALSFPTDVPHLASFSFLCGSALYSLVTVNRALCSAMAWICSCLGASQFHNSVSRIKPLFKIVAVGYCVSGTGKVTNTIFLIFQPQPPRVFGL